jgi:hypothetical protein
MNECSVRRNLRQGSQEHGRLGRHNAVDAQSEAALVAMLLEAFHPDQRMTKKQLWQLVQERHRRTTMREWGNAFIGIQLADLQTCRSIPQEDT